MIELSSRERILRTINGEKVDRVPVFAPSVYGEIVNRASPEETDFPAGYRDEWMREDPNYLDILAFAQKKSDTVQSYEFPMLERKWWLRPNKFTKEIRERNKELVVKYKVSTPRGMLEYIERKKKNISTIWVEKPLIEDKSDVNKLLSIPSSPQKVPLANFFQKKANLGNKGIMFVRVGTPLICVSHLLKFEKFLMWCLTEKDTIRRLVEYTFERFYKQLKYLLENKVGSIFRFCGSEQATPPMMSPRLYDELVVKYDKSLMDLVHEYGGHVAVHCHGNINTVLEKMIDMGVELTDPVEASPDGDIDLLDAKNRTKGKMTLVGNIQFHDLESLTPEEIDKKVKEAICLGGKERFILGTTSGPITFVSKKLRDNYIQFIKSGIKYGKFENI